VRQQYCLTLRKNSISTTFLATSESNCFRLSFVEIKLYENNGTAYMSLKLATLSCAASELWLFVLTTIAI
jgi:hypothetical protein